MIVPIGVNILVRPIIEADSKPKTAGNFSLAKPSEDRQDLIVAKGTVIATGEMIGRLDYDVIFYHYFAGNTVRTDDGEELHFINAEDVLGYEVEEADGQKS